MLKSISSELLLLITIKKKMNENGLYAQGCVILKLLSFCEYGNVGINTRG